MFRAIYKRKLRRTFGSTLSSEDADRIVGQITQLSCLKMLMPMSLFRLFFAEAVSREEALLQTEKISRELSKDEID